MRASFVLSCFILGAGWSAAGAETITVAELASSLPAAPINVVFDVDDTVLFTTPGFQWGARTYGAQVVTAGSPVREQDLANEEDRRKYREFWVKMNTELDQFSVPKWVAGEVIALHKSRGDKIYFVTKRIQTPAERLTELLKQTFQLSDMQPVIFTSRQSKADAFRRIKAAVSYGDSDGDIRDSIAAGARPVRILRAPNSANHEPVHNGGFGEKVLAGSEYD